MLQLPVLSAGTNVNEIVESLSVNDPTTLFSSPIWSRLDGCQLAEPLSGPSEMVYGNPSRRRYVA
jgi:hypothetical protein